MKRGNLCLLPWMVLATTASAQTRMADVVLATHEGAPLKGFRLGDECFVPIDSLPQWGWSAVERGDQVEVSIQGKAVLAPYREFNGRPAVAIRKLVSSAKAIATWDSRTDTLRVASTVTAISYKQGRLKLNTTLPVKASSFILAGPGKLIVEFQGVDITRKLLNTLDRSVMPSWPRPETLRLTIVAPQLGEAPKISEEPNTVHDLDFSASLGVRPVLQQEMPVETKPEIKPNLPTAPPNAAEYLQLKINAKEENPSTTLITLPIPGGIKTAFVRFQRPDANTFRVILPNAPKEFEDILRPKTDSLLSVSAKRDAGRLVLDFFLTKPFGIEASDNAAGLVLRLVKPIEGDGKLNGKMVIVDPGHGGPDPGCGNGGFFEHEITLQVGVLLARMLSEEGCTVILTRRTTASVYPGVRDKPRDLKARGDMAPNNNADFYLSVHVNQVPNGKTNGTMTFYHKHVPISKALADAIHPQLLEYGKLGNGKVNSDLIVAETSGYSVLRNAQPVPAVLLELGFLSNAKDRQRLINSNFQRDIATGVVKGLKVFIDNEKSIQKQESK